MYGVTCREKCFLFHVSMLIHELQLFEILRDRANGHDASLIYPNPYYIRD